MTRAVLADTGPLYAVVDRDDQYHLRAQQDLNSFGRSHTSIVIAASTVLECYTLLLRRLGIGTAHQWIGEVLQGALLVAPTINDIDEASKIILQYSDQPITLFDATLAVVAWRSNLSVWTFDHHFDVMRVPVWR